MPRHPLHISVIGGAGHVGLPLSLLLAKNGFHVTVIDTDKSKIDLLQNGKLPFMEVGGLELLQAVRGISYTTDHKDVLKSDVIILTIGTPIDLHLNPDLRPIYESINQIKPYFRDDQVIILRSTLFPGTSERLYSLLQKQGFKVGVSFCPERIAQNMALKELQEFPQIISGSDLRSLAIARQVFSSFAPEIIELSMTEAELAKLFTNAWRYLRFAIANQFYMLAEEKGFDFYRIRSAMMRHYKRAADFPTAGFAAGPCLFKDTMQLSAYTRQTFALGNAAMLVNETLPDFLVEHAKRKQSLNGTKVGILGMAFKADSDDSRESLAYKLRKLLVLENAVVLCTDPYIQDTSFSTIDKVLECDVLFIGCPHSVYKEIAFQGRHVIDCWGFTRS